jgi:DNA-binding XRE family transcriptional regulator
MMNTLKRMRTTAKLTRAEASGMCLVSVRTWESWEADRYPVPDPIMLLFTILLDLRSAGV